MPTNLYFTVASFRKWISISDFENTFSAWKTIDVREKKDVDFLNRLYESFKMVRDQLLIIPS